MTIPSHRKSSSRTKRGRSHAALKATQLSACPSCKAPTQPHRVCAECGYYRGRKAVATATK